MSDDVATGGVGGVVLDAPRQELLARLAGHDADSVSRFPLSAAQNRLWLLHQLAPQSANYSMPTAIRLRGELDHDDLAAALDTVTARHEALRTRFPSVDGAAWQEVDARARLALDVREAPADVITAVEAEVTRPFDLAVGPLARVVLWRCGEREHILLFVLHHIVADGWSVHVLLRDLTTAYAQLRDGHPAALDPPAVQPADFAVWETGRRSDGLGLQYWREHLAGRPEGLALPTLGKRTGMAGPAATICTQLDAELVARVRSVAQKGHITEFAVLFAAEAALLAIAAGQRDVVVGTPVSGRVRRELVDVVGYFVNVLPLRVRCPVDAEGQDVLAAARDTVAAGLEHQDVPLEEIVRALETRRRATRNPLYDVVFTVQDAPLTAATFPGLAATEISFDPAQTKVDLTCTVQRDGAQRTIQWVYRADVLDRGDVAMLAAAYPAFLEAVLDGGPLPDLRITTSQPGPADLVPELPPAAAQQASEELVIAVWARVLGIDPADIHRDDDFFALGGQSFLAARVAGRLSRDSGREIQVRQVFEAPTVAELAAIVDAAPVLRTSSITPLPADTTTARLSYMQEQLFFLTRFAPESAAYNIPLIARLRGRVDLEVLRRALRWVVNRHEALRTRFEIENGEPIQRVVNIEQAEPQWTERDLRTVTDGIGVAGRLATEQAFGPFDVSCAGSLLRATAFRITDDDLVIALTIHHLVADGVSVRIVARDLGRAYVALLEDTEPPADPRAMRYLDFAAWQRGTPTFDRGVAYWTQALDGAPQSLQLPTRRTRAVRIVRRGTSLPVHLPADANAALGQLAAAHGSTRFMVLAAAVAFVLGRYSGQRDLLLGTPAANRTDPATESLVGLLTNPVTLRADLRGDRTVDDLLRQMRLTCIEAFAHQDVPFERVVEAVAPHRSPSQSPLFQVMLAVADPGDRTLDIPGVECTPIYPENPTTKFDILLNLADNGEHVEGFCEYDADMYEPALIPALIDHVGAALRLFCEDGSARLADVDLLRPAQRSSLVAGPEAVGRAGGYDVDITLHSLVEAAAARTPDAVAVVQAGTGERRSYRDLDRSATALANQLVRAGVGPGCPVGVLLARSPDLIVAALGVLKAGAALLPLDPSWPAARLTTVLHDAGCHLVVAADDRTPADDVTVILPTGHPDAIPVAVRTGPRDVAYIVYTSGSTGSPKGVAIEHRSIANNLLWMQRDWPLSASDRLLHKTAVTFDVSIKEIFWPLLAGATLVLAEPDTERDPVALLRQLDEHDITICHLVPSMLDICLDAAEQREARLGRSLRYLMCGAEELAPDTRDRFGQFSRAQLLHLYGPTETTVAVTGWACRADDPADERVPLGTAMPNAALYVLDRDLTLSLPLVWGELYVGGVPVARGYVARPAETAAAFLPDPFASDGRRMYRTGDVVRHAAHGLLEFRGRADDQVKIRGFRVELGEVEEALRSHAQVRQAIAVLQGKEQSDVHLIAYVTLTDGPESIPDLRGHLREVLPDYMVPAHVVVLDAMPLSPHGKIDRSALPQPAAPRRTGVVGPRDDIERAVAEIWQDVLGLAQIGVDDDFFALGGHSLQAARIVTRLRDRFEREVPMRDMFGEPTIAALARLLRSDRPATNLPRIARHRTRTTTAPTS